MVPGSSHPSGSPRTCRVRPGVVFPPRRCGHRHDPSVQVGTAGGPIRQGSPRRAAPCRVVIPWCGGGSHGGHRSPLRGGFHRIETLVALSHRCTGSFSSRGSTVAVCSCSLSLGDVSSFCTYSHPKLSSSLYQNRVQRVGWSAEEVVSRCCSTDGDRVCPGCMCPYRRKKPVRR